MVVGHPLDTMKTFAQTGRGSPPVRALFRGMLPPVLTAGIVYSGVLGIYENVRRNLSQSRDSRLMPLWVEGIAGSTSGICISVLTSPISRIKIQQQVSGLSFGQTLSHVVSTRTLYTGYTMSLLFETSRGLYMIAYAVLKRGLDHHLNTERRAEFHLPLWARTAAGAGANVICWSIMYPVDVVRSVQMAQAATFGGKDSLKRESTSGAISCARDLVRQGGVSRLYRGFAATLVRAGPVAGIILPCFELVLPWLEGLSTNSGRSVAAFDSDSIPAKQQLHLLRRRSSGPV